MRWSSNPVAPVGPLKGGSHELPQVCSSSLVHRWASSTHQLRKWAQWGELCADFRKRQSSLLAECRSGLLAGGPAVGGWLLLYWTRQLRSCGRARRTGHSDTEKAFWHSDLGCRSECGEGRH